MAKAVEKEMDQEQTTEVVESKETTSVSTQVEAPMGFSDDDGEDLIIPRVKVINALSPERKDKIADEGDILNSLTKEKYNGKKFIPVFKFNNNIWWRDRADGGGIQCIARDAKVGNLSDGTDLLCKTCKKCEFDNTKQGRDAVPKCTKYINFFGFFEGERMPIILSFAKTNYNEGKKLYSLAKVSMQNMWNFKYSLESKAMAKASNEWYVISTVASGATSEEDRAYALGLYKQFSNNLNIAYDMDDSTGSEAAPSVDTEQTEF